jgi:serine protease
MASVNRNLDPPHLIARLREGARTPFPVSPDPTIQTCRVPGGPMDIQNTECNCTTSTCGAGMANALGAVTAALRPVAKAAAQSTVVAGQPVTLSAATSLAANGRSIVGYLWSVVCGGGAPSATDSAATTVTAPTSGSITVSVVVTDDAGKQDSTRLVVNSTSAVPPPAGSTGCPAITVSLLPATVSLVTGATQTFNPAVANAQNTAVSWLVDGVAGGNATVGTISAGGVYTAPAAVPAAGSVTLMATSIEDPTKFASAVITVTAPPPAPAASSGGGGGGAAFDLAALLAALTVLAKLGARRAARAAG